MTLASGAEAMKPNVILTVGDIAYLPVRVVELRRLRAVELAARELIIKARMRGGVVSTPLLRKLIRAVEGRAK